MRERTRQHQISFLRTTEGAVWAWEQICSQLNLPGEQDEAQEVVLALRTAQLEVAGFQVRLEEGYYRTCDLKVEVYVGPVLIGDTAGGTNHAAATLWLGPAAEPTRRALRDRPFAGNLAPGRHVRRPIGACRSALRHL